MPSETGLNSEVFNILKEIPLQTYLYDLEKSRFIYLSKEISNALGYDLSELNLMDSDPVKKLMHPEDHDEYKKIHKHYSQIPKDEWIHQIMRARASNGEWWKMSSRRKVYARKPNGEPLIILGIIDKIVPTREDRADNSRATERHRIVVITDTEGKIIDGNSHFFRIYGKKNPVGINESIFSLIARENRGDFRLKFKYLNSIVRSNQEFIVRLKSDKKQFFNVNFEYLENTERVIAGFAPAGPEDLSGQHPKYNLNIENRISELAKEFLNTPSINYDEKFSKYLNEIAVMIQADFAGFFLYRDNEEILHSCFIPQSEEKADHSLKYFRSNELPTLQKSLLKGDPVIVDLNKTLRMFSPTERKILENGKFKKAIFLPLKNMEKLMGYLLFSADNPVFILDNSVISHLELYTSIYANVLIKYQNEQELKRTEERYILATEASGVGIWDWKVNSEFVYYSDKWKDQLGYRPEELENSFSTWQTLLHPDDYDRMHKSLEIFLKNPTEFFTEEFRLKHKDGSYRWIRNRASAILDEKGNPVRMFGAHQEITEFKEKERELTKLLQAIHQSPMPVIITSTEGVIEFVNPVFSKLTGYDFSEVVGENARILSSGRMGKLEYQKLWREILSGNTWKGEFINKKKNGEIYWELASISPVFNEKREILNFVKVCEDITDIKKMEHELKEAKEKAEAANIHKNNFLANISHEIRTPMNGITGFAELLKKPNLKTEIKNKYVSIINNSSQTLLNLIDDIIDISKIEAGEIRLIQKDINIRELLIDLHALYNRIKHEKKRPWTEIRLSMPPLDHSPVIQTDPNRLRQVLNNLINNALKFTENGSVEFGYNIRKEFLEFFIKDTGIGIREDKHDLIFTRFRQMDESIARKYGGTGLGLAISKGLVELLNGKIWLKSKPGKGTTFYFTIPYIASQINENTELVPGNQATMGLAGKNALVVEDDDINYEFLEAVLKEEGLIVTRASDGVEAVEKFSSNPGFDYILMDINLPRKNGLEATRDILAIDHNQIIIAQTAYAMQEEIEKCLQSGCVDYVTKPIKRKLLINKLQKYC